MIEHFGNRQHALGLGANIDDDVRPVSLSTVPLITWSSLAASSLSVVKLSSAEAKSSLAGWLLSSAVSCVGSAAGSVGGCRVLISGELFGLVMLPWSAQLQVATAEVANLVVGVVVVEQNYASPVYLEDAGPVYCGLLA